MSYDGFISYSHAADDLLAPRLQAALQRFAKPWWKRRAVRIFRDESSLSANPHLWSSITEALDTSGWFVLLLSPDAASSEWVNQEISYWVEHRDPKKILPVVTDGTFGWADDVMTGTAVPDALQGVFSEEPRWVDLRFAKGEEQLDLNNPTFSAAVADIASAIRGVPKDELESEEVRQHRRTVRTAWAAGIVTAALAVAAVGFGFQSARNADEAERQAEIAQQNADEAAANATEADEQRATAEANAEAEARAREEADANAAAEAEARDEADENARLARSRELSAAALTVLEDDPALATRLVVHGASLVDEDRLPVPVVQALWEAGISNKLVDVVDLGRTLYTSLALSRDGSLLAVTLANGSIAFPDVTGTGRLVVFDAKTIKPVWEWTPEEDEGVLMPDISYDGRFLAVSTVAPDGEEDPESRLEVFDLATGKPVTTLRYSDCVWMGAPAWSPDGSVLAITTAESPCERPESSTGRWVEFVDTATWETIRVDELPATRYGSHPEWSDDGELYVFGSHPVYRYGADLGAPEVLEAIGGFGDISPDGSLIVVFDFGYVGSPKFAVFDAETLEIRDLLPWDGFPRFPIGAGFTDDGKSIYVGQEGAKTVFFDVESGASELVLPTSETDAVARDGSTGRIYTSHNDGTVKVWNASATAYGVEQVEDLGEASWVNGSNSFQPGDGITTFDHWDIEAGEHYITFFDQDTGEFVLGPIPSFSRAEGALADGRFVVGPDPNTLVTIDPRTGDQETIYEFDQPMWGPAVSLDGSEIFVLVEADNAGRSAARWWATIDASGNLLETPEELERWPLGFFEATADTALFEEWSTQEIYALDRESGEELWRGVFNSFVTELSEYGFESLGKKQFDIVDLRTGDIESVSVDVDRPRGFEVSPDRTLLAVGDVEKLRIINLATGDEVQSVPIPLVSDIHWIDDQNVVIGSREGVWARLSLNPADLLSAARASLREGFTPGECALYAIDPCPTLDELRGG